MKTFKISERDGRTKILNDWYLFFISVFLLLYFKSFLFDSFIVLSLQWGSHVFLFFILMTVPTV